MKIQLIMSTVLIWLLFSTSALAATAQPELERSTHTDKRRAPPSDIVMFGEQLFQGAFSNTSYTGFNPNYLLNIGDTVSLKMWGAYEYASDLVIDAQGNIFIPSVGPVHIAGIKNEDLQALVRDRITQVYRSNVQSYTSLTSAQPIKIYVSGFATRPGLYEGLSSDSALNFLDQAGGVDKRQGSYIDIDVMRHGQLITKLNLYDFLLNGSIEQIQFHDGDTIHVNQRSQTITVSGLVSNPYRFEFNGTSLNFDSINTLTNPKPSATNIRVIRNTGSVRNVDYYDINDAFMITASSGDEIIFNADKRPGTISVRVEGEHTGSQEHVLPYGTTLDQIITRIQFSEHSNKHAIRLFRNSLKEKQRAMLKQSLHALEKSVLTARSATNEESSLRGKEAERVLQWVERAEAIEPRGQIVLNPNSSFSNVILENGDVIEIPSESSLIAIHGEVLFPNAMQYDASYTLPDYIEKAGGYIQSEKSVKVLVLRPNGSFEIAKARGWGKKLSATISPGDEILVLPQVQLKKLQISKDISQVLYQIALSAAVVLAL